MIAILLIARTLLGGWIKAACTFFGTPLGQKLLIAIIAVVVGWGLYHKGFSDGVKHEQAAEAVRVNNAKAKVVIIEAKAVEITKAVETKALQRQVEIRTVIRTITEKVPTYVTVQADADCSVPVGFVRLHDAATAGRLPDVPGAADEPNDAPSGVPLSAVATVVADNYGIAHGEIARFEALQDWVRQQAANH